MPADSRVQPWKALLDGSPGHLAGSSNIAQQPSSDTEGFLKGQTILNGGQAYHAINPREKEKKSLYDTGPPKPKDGPPNPKDNPPKPKGRVTAPSPEKTAPSNATQISRKYILETYTAKLLRT